MRLLKQFELAFESEPDWHFYRDGTLRRQHDVDPKIVGQALRLPNVVAASLRDARFAQRSGYSGRDHALEEKSRSLLSELGAVKLALEIRVEWNTRLQTCAGRAHFRERLISLNPRLCDHGPAEVDRTLRHELAHLLAQFRAGRRRILPHGGEWQDACRDLGIGDEVRCHNLPFPAKTYRTRFVYRCPSCRKNFPRVRCLRRAVACLACCRKHNGGDFDPRFRLKLVTLC